jgi:sulfur relay (sulfurtransferase) DsrF/TusC family protein
MKSLLIIFSQSPLAGQNLLESLSAAMVMATYGVQINILLTGDAIALLRAPIQPQINTQIKPFKSAFALVESFEFYDLVPIWVDAKDIESNRKLIERTTVEYKIIDLNAQTLAAFDGVLRW